MENMSNSNRRRGRIGFSTTSGIRESQENNIRKFVISFMYQLATHGIDVLCTRGTKVMLEGIVGNDLTAAEWRSSTYPAEMVAIEICGHQTYQIPDPSHVY